jgi:hypothetical protein
MIWRFEFLLNEDLNVAELWFNRRKGYQYQLIFQGTVYDDQ